MQSFLSVGMMVPPGAVSDTSFTDLNEDAVSEVLVKLPSQASLAVAVAVSKPWLRICTSEEFLRRYHRRHTGAGPLLGLLHSTGHSCELRMIRQDGANSRPDLAVTLRNMDKAVLKLTRYRLDLNLWILDFHGGLILLKSLNSDRLFLYNLLTGQHFELLWPPQGIFASSMIGFVMDCGNLVFLSKPKMGRTPRDDCCVYYANVRQWKWVELSCQEADAARYAICKHDIVWKQRAGDVVYSLCGNFIVGYCLAALDMRSMSYSIIDLPNCLWHSDMTSRTRVMEMDNDPKSIGLVTASDAPNFTVRAWLWRRGQENAGQDQGWAFYNPVELLGGLASKLAVELLMVEVVAAYAGVVYLRVMAPAKEHNPSSSHSSYLVSLDLSSGDFTSVHPVKSGWNDKMYPFSLPWRPPFLPPPGDN